MSTSTDVVRMVHQSPLEQPPTYIGKCCREWVMAALFKPGRCGLCGEVPEYERPDS